MHNPGDKRMNKSELINHVKSKFTTVSDLIDLLNDFDDLSTVSTSQLIAELAMRDNCMIVDLPDEYWKLQGVIAYSKHGSRANIIEAGPAKILVVRE